MIDEKLLSYFESYFENKFGPHSFSRCFLHQANLFIMKNIAVIGAGTMGNGIAHTFAQSGFRVQLIDVSENALKKGIETMPFLFS